MTTPVDVRELRVGSFVRHKSNWSYRNDGSTFIEFDFQWNETDFHALGECTLSLEDIEPIPLSEEILLRCGFEKRYESSKGNGIGCYKKSWLSFCLSENGGYTFNEHGHTSIVVKHLHHLQNIVFALTGQELELKA